MLPDDLELPETFEPPAASRDEPAQAAAPVEEAESVLIEQPVLRDEPPPPPPSPRVAASEPADEAFVLDSIEIDLSTALADIGTVEAPSPQAPETVSPAPAAGEVPAQAAAGPPRDLESVFEDIRTRVEREQFASDAGAQYERAVSHIREGRTDQAIADLREVVRTPMLRFKAAAQLGRLLVTGGDLKGSVEWFERAVEAPAPTPNDAFAVLYELATVLEQLGETARALAILIELDGDAGSYRDVRMRIESLTREQAGSRGA
jgi:tetratricopeptide (TPR) repeat protein